MNFFLDENIPGLIATFLMSKGHTIFSTRGTENEGVNDRISFSLAQEKDAIFVTTDKDFFHTIPFLFKNHCGVVVINLQQPNRENITEKFKWFFNNFSLQKLSNTIILLKDNSYTIKNLKS